MATRLANALARRGHRVHVICHALPQQLESHDNIAFHQVAARDYPAFAHVPYALALTSAMVHVAKTHALDILHTHYAIPHAVSAYLACDVLGSDAPRLVTTVHGTDVTLVGSDPTYLPVTRHAIGKSAAVTAPSRFLRDETRRLFDLPEQPIEVLPNFVDSNRFRPRAQQDAAPRVLDAVFDTSASTRDPLTIIHVSNFRPLKRIGDVLKAFALVRSSTPVRLLMVGDGPDRASAEALAGALGIVDRVRFVGARRDVAPLLAASDIFVLPSETESFGLAALEAMSSGLPVVASRVGGLPEVVEDGVCGRLVPVGDVDAIAASLTALVEDSPRRRRMGQSGRERAVTSFALTPAVERYESLYRMLLDRAKPHPA